MRFSKFYYAPKPKPTIDDLSFKFLNGKYPLGGMRSHFGRRETNRAVTQMANTLLMCDPDHVKAQEWMKRMNK